MSVYQLLNRRALSVVVICMTVCRGLFAQSATREGELAPDPRLVLMVSEYQAHWQRAWRDSEEYRRMRIPLAVFTERNKYWHCWTELFIEGGFDRNRTGEAIGFPEPQYHMIQSAHPARGWCPTWAWADENIDVDDESAWRDGALRPYLRASIARKREALLVALERAYAADITNAWLVGQITRFRIDARDFEGAQRAAASCRAAAWWCAGLAGLSQARAGKMSLADSTFAQMRRVMPDGARCAWEDASVLLSPKDQPAYRKIDCAQRDTVNAQLWWLADPLYRETGNARLVEQEVRRMDIALRKAVAQDERFAFDDERGGDAVVEVFSRYGWPSYAAWEGLIYERGESFQGLEINHNSPPAPTYTTLEYALGRVSTIPSWSAIVSPFTALAGDWTLGPVDSVGVPSKFWWPQEHFYTARRLLQLPMGQTVSVRRQTYVDVAVAVDLTNAAVPTREAYEVLLLSTSTPGRVDSIDRQHSSNETVARLRGRIASAPTILAIEAQFSSSMIDARSRYAYSPPQPLSALAPQEIAVSDIAILSPLSPIQVAQPTDSLLQYLSASTTFRKSERRVTLYWESYGTTPVDSAEVLLRVVRESDAGLLRRLGTAAGLLSDPSQGISIRWRDNDARGGKTTLVGPVTAQMHAVALDLSALKPGRYAIDITMALRDGRTATQQTVIELSE